MIGEDVESVEIFVFFSHDTLGRVFSSICGSINERVESFPLESTKEALGDSIHSTSQV